MNVIEKINSFQNLSPEYDGMLSNHLPMALYALDQLGASHDEIESFVSSYFKMHDIPLCSPTSVIDLQDENWHSFLGTRRYYTDFRLFYLSRLKRLGRDQFISRYFIPLIKGYASAAYHGLLRLSYGVLSGNDEEIAAGMAYMADSFLEMKGPLPKIAEDALSLHSQLNLVSKKFEDGQIMLPELNGIIFERMDQISNPNVFCNAKEVLSIQPYISLRDFSEAALNIYLTTDNFTALHMLTSCHAARIMMPYVADKTEMLRYVHQAFMAAYLSIGAPRITEFSANAANIDAETVKKLSRNSHDDHCVKLAYSCVQESAAYDNPLYLYAAIEKNRRNEVGLCGG